MFRVVIGLLILTPALVVAKDFGVNAATYPVAEEGLVAMIKRKIKTLDLKAEQQKLDEIVKQRIERPESLVDITAAKEDKTFNIDPSYVLPEDVYLPDGKLLYAKGTKVNPLERIDWQQKLIFINGDNQAHLDWVLANYLSTLDANEQVKVILVAGSPADVAKALNINVYFDQFGELTAKFQVKHVPATVERDNLELKVSEFKV